MKCPVCREEVDTRGEYVETKEDQVTTDWHWACWLDSGGE
jgi:hypothetical protein